MKSPELYPAQTFLRRHFPAGGRVLCAVSGGLDSMCLLHFLHTWGKSAGFSVVAAHFHHGLRPGADGDEAFVRAWCQREEVPFVCGRGDVRTLARQEGLSLEEAGRKMRYAFLRRSAREQDCAAILTAHHADDNAETMLFHLLRGTAPQGLQGIPPVRGNLLRPFLAIPRQELEEYARRHHLEHVEDETNQTDQASRNVLRHQVLPVLRQLNPRAVEHMSRTAQVLAEESAVLEELAAAVTGQARQEERGTSLPCEALAQCHRAIVRRAVLRLLEAAAGQRKGNLTAAHVEAVTDLALSGRPGQAITLPYGLTARRDEERLYVEKKPPSLPEQRLLPGQEADVGLWRVRLERAEETSCVHQGQSLEFWASPQAEIRVGSWRRRDAMMLPGAAGSRSFKRLCLDRGISLDQREQLPVVRVDGQMTAVPGIGVAADAAKAEGKEHLRVIFINKQTGERKEDGHEK